MTATNLTQPGLEAKRRWLGDAAEITVNRVLAWSGVLLTVLFLGGFLIAGWLPPLHPRDSVHKTAQIFSDNRTRIRLGMLVCLLSSALATTWAAAIALQLRRIPRVGRTFAYLALAAGLLSTIEFIVPYMIWEAAAYRPLESPEMTRRLNDLAWLMFDGVNGTVVLQAATIGVAVLLDSGDDPIFPRWFGFFNLWAAFLITPSAVCVLVKSGPLAWNGIISWWLVLTVFCVWILVDSAMVLSAIGRRPRTE
jgi:hypothetical protein